MGSKRSVMTAKNAKARRMSAIAGKYHANNSVAYEYRYGITTPPINGLDLYRPEPVKPIKGYVLKSPLLL